MPRVLIIGYGTMGRIHAKHLSELGVSWDFHDPFVLGGVGLDRLADYSHAIIATPIPTHHEVYRQLEEFPGRILIEKPVVVLPEQLHVLDEAVTTLTQAPLPRRIRIPSDFWRKSSFTTMTEYVCTRLRVGSGRLACAPPPCNWTGEERKRTPNASIESEVLSSPLGGMVDRIGFHFARFLLRGGRHGQHARLVLS